MWLSPAILDGCGYPCAFLKLLCLLQPLGPNTAGCCSTVYCTQEKLYCDNYARTCVASFCKQVSLRTPSSEPLTTMIACHK